MIKLRKVLWGGIGLYVFVAGTFVYADNPPSVVASAPTGKHGGGGIQGIYSQLNLTDIQKKQLEDNKAQHRANMQSAREQAKALRQAFQQELMKPQMDMNKIHELHGRMKALESQMADERLSSILAVRAILTPQQFSEFMNLMHKHKEGHAQSPEHKGR